MLWRGVSNSVEKGYQMLCFFTLIYVPDGTDGAQTQIRQVHKCGKKAMNKHRRDVSSPPTTVRIAQNTLQLAHNIT